MYKAYTNEDYVTLILWANLVSTCGLAEQSKTHKRKVVSSNPVNANVFVSLGKILNLACLVDPSDIWGMSQFNVR